MVVTLERKWAHLFFLGPTAYFNLANVVMRHDIRDGVDAMSTVNPHLIFDGFSTPLGMVLVLFISLRMAEVRQK